jgi:hypothetical protein
LNKPTTFTDLAGALDEARFVADEVRDDGQRHAAYLVQRPNGLIAVNAWRPHGPTARAIMMTVHPKFKRVAPKVRAIAKPNHVPGVTHQPQYKNYRAVLEHDGAREYAGVHANWFDAVCARKSLENLFNKEQSHV